MTSLKEFIKTLTPSFEIDRLQEFLRSLPSTVLDFDPDTTIVTSWNIEDINVYIEDHEIENADILTKKDKFQILENIDHRHDASIGINWDVIEFHIEDFIDKKIHEKNMKLKNYSRMFNDD